MDKIKNFLQFSDFNPLQSLQDSHSDAGLPITELINNFFVGISADLPELDINILSDLADDYNTDYVIDPSEVDLCLAKINIHPGPDGIPNWLLRDFSQLLCYPLAAIFNAFLEGDSFLQFRSQRMWLQSPRSIHLLLSKMILDQYLFSQL